MIDTHFLEQLFQQHGLLGLLVGFLILGPGFTYIRTRNTQLHIESKAQELVNEFARHQREHAEQLERRLSKALAQLNRAKEEVTELKLKLANAQQCLDDLPEPREQIASLTQTIAELQNIPPKTGHSEPSASSAL